MVEDSPAEGTAGKHRIVIHAGFGKCGSSSIQRALVLNRPRLRKQQVYVFDKNLNVARDDGPRAVPHVILTEAKKKKKPVVEKLTKALDWAASGNGQSTAVLSAESLAIRGMEDLFIGLDQQCDLSVVFYVRPQWQWIPSAWQQWFMKDGTSLNEFVARCLETTKPAFRQRVEEWQNTLPAAQVRVRFLISEMLEGKDPARDFFHLLGLTQDGYEFEADPRNTSLDYSVLHVLSKNPHLFAGMNDIRLRKGLRFALAKKFQSANIRMLSSEQEAQIEEHFREDNLWLLRTYGGNIDVDEIYRKYFIAPKAATRYPDIGDLDLIYRCLGIMLEAIAVRRQPQATKHRTGVVEPED